MAGTVQNITRAQNEERLTKVTSNRLLKINKKSWSKYSTYIRQNIHVTNSTNTNGKPKRHKKT